MSRAASRQAAEELLKLCENKGVKIPTVSHLSVSTSLEHPRLSSRLFATSSDGFWRTDPKNAKVAAGTMLNATKKDGEFQIDDALEALIKKYGVDANVKSEDDTKKEDGDDKSEEAPTKKRKRKAPVKKESESEEDEPKEKKARAKPKAICEENQSLSDIFVELSGYEFKRGEKFKGATWSKVAKALREAENPITSGKEATKLKNVGKSSSAKIDEILETGTLTILEEFREGKLE